MDDELRDYLVNGGSMPARVAREWGDDDQSLSALDHWSHTQRWAWDELQRRVRECLEQGRAPTGRLAFWAGTVADGRKPPRRRQHEDRDWRVLAVVTVLMRGMKESPAVHMVAPEINRSTSDVYSILRKLRQGPFVRNSARKST